MNIETVSHRALELHEKASMPLSEALALAMREAAPSPIWPIARLFIDSGGNVCSGSHLYAPGLPEGEHDAFPLPVDANATPFWCEQTETWLYKDESRKAFKNRPLDPQPPRPAQRFMVSDVQRTVGIVTLVTINAEDVRGLEPGDEVTLAPGVMAPQAQSRLLELVNKLDGYLNSPEQIALRDELLGALGVAPCGEAQPLVWQFKVGGGQWQECSEKNARAYREQGAPFKVRALREVAADGVLVVDPTEKLRRCSLGCVEYGQCKAVMHGDPGGCTAGVTEVPRG